MGPACAVHVRFEDRVGVGAKRALRLGHREESLGVVERAGGEERRIRTARSDEAGAREGVRLGEQGVYPRARLLRATELRERRHDHADRVPALDAPRLETAHGSERVGRRVGQAAAPPEGVGLRPVQPRARLFRRRGREPALGVRDRAFEIAAPERVLGRARVVRDRFFRPPALVEMLREDGGVLLTDRLEPARREAVPDPPVLLREHRVCPLAQEGVAEHVLVVIREFAGRTADDPLAVLEEIEPAPEERAPVSAEQRLRPLGPERLPEDARRAEHLARFGLEPLEARLEHRED